jgi:hypothetical protein
MVNRAQEARREVALNLVLHLLCLATSMQPLDDKDVDVSDCEPDAWNG